jgi:penicillin-binding protein-related factor A (putative recombinase)
MKRKEEQRLWDTFKTHRPPGYWMERIENIVGFGTPDVDVAHAETGRIVKVELKAPNAPANPNTRLLGDEGLNKHQINWHMKAASYRMPVFTLIRDNQKRIFLVHCDYAEHMNDMTAAQLAAVSLADTWEGVFEVLK